MELSKRIKLYKLWQKKGVRAFKGLPTLERRIAENARKEYELLD